ncbi:MAG: SIMPL domain-containing protein [Pseudomonadota bacterium]
MSILKPIYFAAITCLLAALSMSVASADEVVPKIVVSGTGTASIEPDMAILNLRVVRQGATAGEALSANNEAMARILEEMRSRGIEDRDLQTARFNISPRYEQINSNSNIQRDPRIIGYDVSNSLTVRVRDLARVGEILDRSVTLAVNQGGGIRLTNDDPSAAIEEARINAMREAMEKARVLTEAAGIGLGQVLEISEPGAGAPRGIVLAEAAIGSSRAGSVPIASGENSYSVTVNVTYALDQ